MTFDIQRFAETYGFMSPETRDRINASLSKEEASETYLSKSDANKMFVTKNDTDKADAGYLNKTSLLMANNAVLVNTIPISSNNVADMLRIERTADGGYKYGNSLTSDAAYPLRFSVNDGVNGNIESSNSEVAIISTLPNVKANNYYRLDVKSLTEAAELNIPTGVSKNTLRSQFLTKDITDDNIVELLAKSNKTLNNIAITLKLNDRYNQASINISYAELLSTTLTCKDIFGRLIEITNRDTTIKVRLGARYLNMVQTTTASGCVIDFSVSYDKNSDVSEHIQKFLRKLFPAIEDTVRVSGAQDFTIKNEWQVSLKNNALEAYITPVDQNGSEIGAVSAVYVSAYNRYIQPTDNLVLDSIRGFVIRILKTGTTTFCTTQPAKVFTVTMQRLLNGYTFHDFAEDFNKLNTNILVDYNSRYGTLIFYNKVPGEKNHILFGSAVNDANYWSSIMFSLFFENLGYANVKDGTFYQVLAHYSTNGENFVFAESKNNEQICNILDIVLSKMDSMLTKGEAMELYAAKNALDVSNRALCDIQGEIIHRSYVKQHELEQEIMRLERECVSDCIPNANRYALVNKFGETVCVIPILPNA